MTDGIIVTGKTLQELAMSPINRLCEAGIARFEARMRSSLDGRQASLTINRLHEGITMVRLAVMCNRQANKGAYASVVPLIQPGNAQRLEIRLQNEQSIGNAFYPKLVQIFHASQDYSLSYRAFPDSRPFPLLLISMDSQTALKPEDLRLVAGSLAELPAASVSLELMARRELIYLECRPGRTSLHATLAFEREPNLKALDDAMDSMRMDVARMTFTAAYWAV